MAIHISPASARIEVTQAPGVLAPNLADGSAEFRSVPLALNGTVDITGVAADNREGWLVGWIQAEWVETNWQYYKGQSNADGSILLQRARPPARPARSARDTLNINDIFTRPLDNKGLGAGPFPVRVTIPFVDRPADSCNLVEVNTLTRKANFLSAAQFEFMFCTVLTVQDPHRVFHHVGSIYWNLRWQYEFKPLAFPNPGAAQWEVTRVAAGTGAATGHMIPGTPIDHRFAAVLTTPQAQNANSLAAAASDAVSRPGPSRKEALLWQDFNVRQ